jgi:hypothetical protein
MKIHSNDLLHRLDEADNELSLFVSYAESDVNWRAVPAHKIPILLERLDLIREAVTQMYTLLDPYLK